MKIIDFQMINIVCFLLVIPRIDPNGLAINVPIPSANIASCVG